MDQKQTGETNLQPTESELEKRLFGCRVGRIIEPVESCDDPGWSDWCLQPRPDIPVWLS